MRLNKYLASCGICSRRNADTLISGGKICINGNIVTNLATDVKDNDIVSYNNRILKLLDNKVYIMLNKPKCYICSLKDEKDRNTVLKLTKNIKERIFPVGRLDYNTEGLIILTNDGDFANSIIHPSKHIEKTYEVKTKISLSNKDLSRIRKGMMVDNIQYLPAKVQSSFKENADSEYFTTIITIIEGKNHEVRNIFKALNHKVYNLKRIKIGDLDLGNLPMGKYRVLSKCDINKIYIGDK